MKKILVTGAGGSPATNFVRSLRASKDKFFLVGLDADEYYVHRSETDISYLCPPRTDKKYIPFINYIAKKHELEVIHVQNDSELEVISEAREQLRIRTYLPSKETVKICLNKFASQKKWEENGLKVPKSRMIHTPNDLEEAFNEYGGKVWIREISGAGGKGSLAPKDILQAEAWINFNEGWGKFIAAELLSADTVTWMSIWNNGELVVAQGRKRLYWELAKISPSGVTGVTGAGLTSSDLLVDDIAIKAIKSIDSKPHGIFSVDLTIDFNKVPNPTEINIGRFFTTHEFFTRAGLNMPEIFLNLAYGEKLPKFPKKINPLPDNLLWIRGVDFLPIFTDMGKFQKKKEEYKSIINSLK